MALQHTKVKRTTAQPIRCQKKHWSLEAICLRQMREQQRPNCLTICEYVYENIVEKATRPRALGWDLMNSGFEPAAHLLLPAKLPIIMMTCGMVALCAHIFWLRVCNFHCQWCTRHVRKVVVIFMMFFFVSFSVRNDSEANLVCAFHARSLIYILQACVFVCFYLRYRLIGCVCVCIYIRSRITQWTKALS